MQSGSHNPERVTPLLGLCHGVLTNPFISDISVRKAREPYLIKRGKTLEPLVIDKKDEMLYISSICLIYTFFTFQISLITASTAFVARWGFSESIPPKLEH